MNSLFKIALVAGVLLSFTSCKKDKENPTISISEPVNHSHFHWGDEIHIESTFSDDRALASYHIFMGTEAGVPTPDFDIEYSGNIEGTSYDFHEHFNAPDSIAMVYYLHFEVTDEEGKSATDKIMLHFEE